MIQSRPLADIIAEAVRTSTVCYWNDSLQCRACRLPYDIHVDIVSRMLVLSLKPR
jgi:hypothetical protein